MLSEPKIDKNDPAQREVQRKLSTQHLEEAHATEQALVTNLRAHIAMTPRQLPLVARAAPDGDHGHRAGGRPPDPRGHAAMACCTLSTASSPPPSARRSCSPGPAGPPARRPARRGQAAQERRDEVVTEALEIAIYDAIEALAHLLGDEPTAARGLPPRCRRSATSCASTSRGQAVAQARAGGRPSFDWGERAPPTRSARRGGARAAGRRPRAARG